MQPKQESLEKYPRPLTLPLSPQLTQSRHFSQNPGATGCSVTSPGPGSVPGGRGAEGGGTASGGPDTRCAIGPESVFSGMAGCTGAVPPVSRTSSSSRGGDGGGGMAEDSSSPAWARKV